MGPGRAVASRTPARGWVWEFTPIVGVKPKVSRTPPPASAAIPSTLPGGLGTPRVRSCRRSAPPVAEETCVPTHPRWHPHVSRACVAQPAVQPHPSRPPAPDRVDGHHEAPRPADHHRRHRLLPRGGPNEAGVDRRPLHGATVKIAGRTTRTARITRTNANGLAIVHATRGETVTVTAGNTFRAASAQIR